MTEAKELDPAALEAATAQLQMYLHKGVSVERSIEIVGAAISTYLEALSTAPVALEVSEECVEAAARAIVASTAPLIADDEHWPVAVKGYREMCGWYPDYADGHSLVTDAFRNARIALSAIHPAPSREAVIDRAAIIEECARVADNELVRRLRKAADHSGMILTDPPRPTEANVLFTEAADAIDNRDKKGV